MSTKVKHVAARRQLYRLVRRYGGNDGPIMWNPWNKVVQDHRSGMIYHDATNEVRAAIGLPVPWTPELADADIRKQAVHLSPNHKPLSKEQVKKILERQAAENAETVVTPCGGSLPDLISRKND